MNLNGLVLLPSLNRPHLVKRLFEAYLTTKAKIHGVLLVDKEDACLKDYEALELPQGWELIKTQGVTMGDKIEEVKERWWGLDYVGILNDDHVPKTEEWDFKVVSQIKGHNIVTTNDGYKAPHRLCGFICLSGPLIRELGWFFPPGVKHLFTDDAWELIAHRTGCATCLMDVMVHHDHVFVHQKEDTTHRKVYADESWQRDKAAFDIWLQTKAEKDAMRILAMQPKMGLMIATPTHDNRCSYDYALGLTDSTVCFAQMGQHMEHARVKGSSLIAHSRNSLAEMFLASKCQKLLFIDEDQGFSRSDIMHLFQSNKRVVAGVVPHKRFPINLNFEPLPEHHHYFQSLTNKSPEEFVKYAKECANEKGEIEVTHAGTGMMAIDRSVFEIMKDHVNKYKPFDNDPSVIHHEFFRMGTNTDKNVIERYHGEDFWFTLLCKQLEIPIFINANVIISHQGTFVWDLRAP
ncbi:MAG TPA: hypothetical protein PLQ20_02070 [Candidatus Paceibacterota bacterium]|nr:hypothetical protein [Candidatus Paceibacterota bacterium]